MNNQQSALADSFSLIRGGPSYHFLNRIGASREERSRVIMRAIGTTLITWLPLLICSIWQGLAYGRRVDIPFLYDIAVNVRFLVAMPILILAESGIDAQIHRVVNHFLDAGLVSENELPAFDNVLSRITKLRDRAAPEIVMLIIAYLPSLSVRSAELMMNANSSWHTLPGSNSLTLAGWWFGMISAPFFRFLLLRWLWRMILWSCFLWQVSHIPLLLTPTHPDLAGGLGFIEEAQRRFSPIVFAGSAVVAGQLGNSLAYEGATVSSLKFVMIAYCAFAIILITAPLLLLAPLLIKVKRRGILDYGILASRYTQEFDTKWVHPTSPAEEALLGTGDIQSLADLGNSSALVRQMGVVPLDKRLLVVLVVASLLPLLPVIIFGTPTDELIKTLIKMLA